MIRHTCIPTHAVGADHVSPRFWAIRLTCRLASTGGAVVDYLQCAATLVVARRLRVLIGEVGCRRHLTRGTSYADWKRITRTSAGTSGAEAVRR